jgi:hypothetical protein
VRGLPFKAAELESVLMTAIDSLEPAEEKVR